MKAAFAAVGVTIDTSGSNCAPPSSDNPPTISITAPANNATVSGVVNLTASASDDHGVASVEFFVDGVSIGTGTRTAGTATSGVWSINWTSSSVGNGSHAITAKALDNGSPSHATTSSAINVNVNNNVLHIGALNGASTAGPGGKWNASVTITIHDPQHLALANATVSGTWSNGAAGSGSCKTNSSGTCSVTKSNLKGTVPSVKFTVNTVTRSSYTYDAVNNDVPSSVTVQK